MALPTPAKTWVIDPCNSISYTSYLQRTSEVMLAIKNSILTMSGVTVKGSCNGTTGAMDGTDRWTTSTDVQTRTNSATAAQSWIVLKFANMGGAELLLTYQDSFDYRFGVQFSAGGNFAAAATATHRPTATDYQVMLNPSAGTRTPANGGGIAFATSGVAALWTTWLASDGSALYFGIASAAEWWSIVSIQLVSSAVTSGTFSPAAVCFTLTPSSVFGYGGMLDIWESAPVTSCRINSLSVYGFFGTEAAKTGIAPALYTAIAELQGSGHNMFPVMLWSETPGARGFIGTVTDMWVGNSTAASGDTYPNDTSRLFVQVGDMILPWDGSAVVMT